MAANASVRTATVLEEHRYVGVNPIIVGQGEPLLVDREDDEYPGWYWCTDARGHDGWVWGGYIDLPEALPATAHTTAPYTAVELTVSKGEAVQVLHTAGGWAWCRRPSQPAEEGWLPTAILQLNP